MTTRIIVVTDIFGQTEALDRLTTSLSDNICIVDPYQEVRFSFEDDKQAYQHFVDSGGMDSYTSLLAAKLALLEEAYILIGFSAGAAASWRCIAQPDNKCLAAILFYGGQIRHYTSLEPVVKTTLIHPHAEEHFDLNAVEKKLVSKSNVKIIPTEFQHGFMNEYSKGFDCLGLAMFKRWLANFLQKKTYVNT